jgi:hypothetical protein
MGVGPEQELILANLLELYAHDFSEFHELELGSDGRFGYGGLPLYWSEPECPTRPFHASGLSSGSPTGTRPGGWELHTSF